MCVQRNLLLVGEDYVTNKKTEEDVVNKEKQWLVCQTGKSSRSKESNQSRRRAGLEQHFETGKAACRSSFAGSAFRRTGRMWKNSGKCKNMHPGRSEEDGAAELSSALSGTPDYSHPAGSRSECGSFERCLNGRVLSGSGTSEKRRCRSFFDESGTTSESGRKDGKPWLCEKSGTFG